MCFYVWVFPSPFDSWSVSSTSVLCSLFSGPVFAPPVPACAPSASLVCTLFSVVLHYLLLDLPLPAAVLFFGLQLCFIQARFLFLPQCFWIFCQTENTENEWNRSRGEEISFDFMPDCPLNDIFLLRHLFEFWRLRSWFFCFLFSFWKVCLAIMALQNTHTHTHTLVSMFELEEFLLWCQL